MLELKDYQKRSLEALESYLRSTVRQGAKTAFVIQTEQRYRSAPQMPELPYVCLRVPTGGGKTFMACHALGIVADALLQAERAVCLWLVPSNAIREQTLAALKQRAHPYRAALDLRFGGQVSVLDLSEALYVQRSTLAAETVVIVSTLAALRVTDPEGRKVYESAGALLHHFTGLSDDQAAQLDKREDGSIACSLCNVLRMWRPILLVDEAHNANTELSFETLARFNPSCVLEFTATPERQHDPERERFASNVLHHVSAAELKAEEMIKLPVRLETHADWRQAVAAAVRMQRHLEELAQAEERETGEYIRPIVLLQAQPRNQARQTLTVDLVERCLIDDCRVSEDQIREATGQTRGIEGIDLSARDCPVRFVITVAALKEGWDCPFAYVLCSVADIGSTRAVEQVLGRVLRMPRARRKRRAELNLAYAFVTSPRFSAAAQALTDALIGNGFQRLEAEAFVGDSPTQGTLYEPGMLDAWTRRAMPEAPALGHLPQPLARRVTFDAATNTLAVNGPLTEPERTALAECFRTPQARREVDALFQLSRGRPIALLEGESWRVPGLALRVDGQLELFEESHFLGGEWRLSDALAELSEGEFPSFVAGGEAGELDVSDAGRIEWQRIAESQRQLELLGIEHGWSLDGLVTWIDRHYPHPDITWRESTLFVRRIVEFLRDGRGLSIEALARERFRLCDAVATKVDEERAKHRRDAFQRMLWSADRVEIEVSPERCFEISSERYAPSRIYDGACRFAKHRFAIVGDLQSEGEEFQCAEFLDQMVEIEAWLRNLQRPGCSFSLPTATDRFYPDFVARLVDGRWLVIEYKGEHLFSNDDSREKREIGKLWAERSGGCCLFVMTNGPRWSSIEDAVRGAAPTDAKK